MSTRYVLSSIVCTLIVVCLTFSSATAQVRIGYIDAQKILKQMPEALDAESHLNQYIQQWNKEVSDMQAELARKQNEYDRKKLIMSDAERSAAEGDLVDLKKRIDQFRQAKYGPSGELVTQQDQLMKPVYDKLNKALNEVALDNKYDFIFDKSAKELALLYTNAKFDLTVEVAKKLGIETNDVFSTPLLGKNNTKPGTTNPNGQAPANGQVPPSQLTPGQPVHTPPSGMPPILTPPPATGGTTPTHP